jgi:hypothetical protein
MLTSVALAALLAGQTVLAFAPHRLSQPSISRAPTTTSLYLGDFFNFGKEKEEEAQTTATAEEELEETGYVDEDDPIEKIFGVFFGKKEKAPMGMPRFGQERFPEQYPATLDEWADPLEGDDAEMALLRPLLKNTNLETRNIRLTYDANKDGWDPETFHSKVDKQGGGIVFCTTRSGIKCGGYNPKGWVGYGEARGSIAAFLFILGGKYANASTGAPGIKLRKVGGPGLGKSAVCSVRLKFFRGMNLRTRVVATTMRNTNHCTNYSANGPSRNRAVVFAGCLGYSNATGQSTVGTE